MKKFTLFIIIILVFVTSIFVYAETIWKDSFDEIENWYDNKADSSFKAVIVPGKKKGTAMVKQQGKGDWGKVAFVITKLDIDKYNILKVKVNKVSKNGDYKILVTSLDWNKSYTIIDRGRGKGIHKRNIKEITKWKGEKTFNLVIIIEGKKKMTEFDWIEIASEEEKEEE